MTRKIITSAVAALAVATFTAAPRVADAGTVNVSATVSAAATIGANDNATTTSWTGASTAAIAFTVTVTSNDSAGYKFTFTSTNGTAPAFLLKGTAIAANTVTYTVTGPTETYTSGVLGTHTYGGPASGVVTSFNINLPTSTNIPADIYTDILTVAVNPA